MWWDGNKASPLNAQLLTAHQPDFQKGLTPFIMHDFGLPSMESSQSWLRAQRIVQHLCLAAHRTSRSECSVGSNAAPCSHSALFCLCHVPTARPRRTTPPLRPRQDLLALLSYALLNRCWCTFGQKRIVSFARPGVIN